MTIREKLREAETAANADTLDGFRRARRALIDAARELAAFTARRDENGLSKRASALAEKLEKAQFNLVVIGEFKRGKSTLVNALLGAQLLPTAVVPLTSIVTVIGYGDSPKARVDFTDGRTEEISVKSISDYITERGNPENRRGVRRVEVEYPSPILRSGVRIVDTPGTGSVYQHNTEATYEFLPEADAVIFLLTADQPASRAELDLLRDSRRYAARFFFVQNKIDYLSENERQESLDFLRQVLSAELEREVTIYPVSARLALEAQLDENYQEKLETSGFISLETDISNFLAQEKAELLIEIIKSRLLVLTREAEQFIALERQMAKMPVAAIDERVAAFNQATEKIISTEREAEYIVRGETSALIGQIEKELNLFVETNRKPLVKEIENAFDSRRNLNKREIIAALTAEMNEKISGIFNEWRKLEEERVQNSFARITAQFAARANNIIEEIKKITADIFDVEITAPLEVEPLTTESRHYYLTENPFRLELSKLPLILPAPLAKHFIRKSFIESIELELSRNAGRLRADFQERIEKSTQKFLRGFQEKLQTMIAEIEETLKSAATRRRTSQAESVAAEARLANDNAELKRIEEMVQSD